MYYVHALSVESPYLLQFWLFPLLLHVGWPAQVSIIYQKTPFQGCTPIEVVPVPNAYTTCEQTCGVLSDILFYSIVEQCSTQRSDNLLWCLKANNQYGGVFTEIPGVYEIVLAFKVQELNSRIEAPFPIFNSNIFFNLGKVQIWLTTCFWANFKTTLHE